MSPLPLSVRLQLCQTASQLCRQKTILPLTCLHVSSIKLLICFTSIFFFVFILQTVTFYWEMLRVAMVTPLCTALMGSASWPALCGLRWCRKPVPAFSFTASRPMKVQSSSWTKLWRDSGSTREKSASTGKMVSRTHLLSQHSGAQTLIDLTWTEECLVVGVFPAISLVFTQTQNKKHGYSRINRIAIIILEYKLLRCIVG